MDGSDKERTSVDFSMLALRAKFDIPEGWEVYAWERKNFDTKAEYVQFSGAVVTEVFKRGPRKGQKNWAVANRSHAMDLPLTFAEIDAAKALWSAETGLCHHCQGNGTAWSGWSATDGNHYKFCKPCDGTGLAAS